MKKFILIIIVALIIISNHSKPEFSLTNYFKGNYNCYTSEDKNGIDLGFCSISNTQTKNCIGESIEINNLEIASALKTLKATVNKTEYLEDGTTVIYAYSPLIKRNIFANSNKTNLQIATKNNTTIIGWPLILGSF